MYKRGRARGVRVLDFGFEMARKPSKGKRGRGADELGANRRRGRKEEKRRIVEKTRLKMLIYCSKKTWLILLFLLLYLILSYLDEFANWTNFVL
jgi:hypothetical protein